MAVLELSTVADQLRSILRAVETGEVDAAELLHDLDEYSWEWGALRRLADMTRRTE